MRENKHGAECDPAWNKVWGSVPHPSFPARVCVCVAESESLTTPVVADAWTLLSKWHGYLYLPIQSLLQPLQDLLLTPRVTDGETEARRGKHRSLFFASWTGIGQLRGSGSDAHSPFFLPRQIQNPGGTQLARPVLPTPPWLGVPVWWGWGWGSQDLIAIQTPGSWNQGNADGLSQSEEVPRNQAAGGRGRPRE